MSTWFIDDKRTWCQRLFGEVLKVGPLPKHVGIIMDGNRRYAKSKNIKKIEGHISGFEKLVEALSWCFNMNIKEVTVYAFSIENFKRSQDEVDALFDLARESFQRLLNEKDKIMELGVCIRIIGEITLLPADLQQIVAKVINLSKVNRNLFMNVCIAYTSREEMTTAVRDICEGVKNKKLDLLDVDETLIENCLYTNNSLDVDLLVRTSGEVRLSDFLLWQSNFSAISFVKKTWPEFSVWNFYMGILNFQLNSDNIQKLKAARDEKRRSDLDIACRMHAIENRQQLIDRIRQKDLSSSVQSNHGSEAASNNQTSSLQALAKHVASEAVDTCLREHDKRTSQFTAELKQRRLDKIESMLTVVS